MKKLYPIHIITFIMSIFIRWEWIKKFDINQLFMKMLLNITLLQSLSKQSIFIFNGLSWFLSITFILYIIACLLIFEIIDNEDAGNINWTHRWWGHVVLPQLKKI